MGILSWLKDIATLCPYCEVVRTSLHDSHTYNVILILYAAFIDFWNGADGCLCT